KQIKALLSDPPAAKTLPGPPLPADIGVFKEIDHLRDEFFKAMDDDFNTASATGVLFQAATLINKYLARVEQHSEQHSSEGLKRALDKTQDFLDEAGQILGVFQQPPEVFLQEVLERKLQNVDLSLPEIEQLIAERAEARKKKDWARA